MKITLYAEFQMVRLVRLCLLAMLRTMRKIIVSTANKKVKPVLDLDAGDALIGADMSNEENARKNVAAVAASEE